MRNPTPITSNDAFSYYLDANAKTTIINRFNKKQFKTLSKVTGLNGIIKTRNKVLVLSKYDFSKFNKKEK